VVHHVWTYLAYIAETIIFMLAGLIIGVRIMESQNIFWDDYLKCIALYVLLHLIRFICLVCAFPFLRMLGYGMTFRQVILFSYAGLRGAMGLILALIVVTETKKNDDLTEEDNAKIKDVILLLTAGVALLSIIINGNTTGLLVNKLGLAKVASPLKMKLLHNLLEQIDDEVDEILEHLKQNEAYNLVEWDILRASCELKDVKKDIEEFRKQQYTLYKEKRIQKLKKDYIASLKKLQKADNTHLDEDEFQKKMEERKKLEREQSMSREDRVRSSRIQRRKSFVV